MADVGRERCQYQNQQRCIRMQLHVLHDVIILCPVVSKRQSRIIRSTSRSPKGVNVWVFEPLPQYHSSAQGLQNCLNAWFMRTFKFDAYLLHLVHRFARVNPKDFDDYFLAVVHS